MRCYFTPNKEVEAKIKEETKATVRCIPFEQAGTAEQGCVHWPGDDDAE